jgi:polysaccharide deacetylase family protein (PEP-CTERM system associated)
MPTVTVSRSVFLPSPTCGLRSPIESIFSIDVKDFNDWYHMLRGGARPPLSAWDTLPALVEANFLELLDLFSERNVHVTCFFVGWIAERFPHLVKEAAHRGHEIASHGYKHRLIVEMTQSEFLEDALRSRRVLEDVAGCAVRGYRAAGFFLIQHAPWFFDKLCEASYEYDSSEFPSGREHGEMTAAIPRPHRVVCRSGVLTEFPITVATVLGTPLRFSGGEHLRLLPMWLILKMARTVIAEGRPVIYYIHPREIDHSHPWLPIHRRRKHDISITERKMARIAGEFPFITFGQFLDRYRDLLGYRYLRQTNRQTPSLIPIQHQVDLRPSQQS